MNVAVASFWQLARHWKMGDKAKLELSCEGEKLHIQLSAVLGHPDHPHFPPPTSPSLSSKKKSPSQLRRQERRRQEALLKSGKAKSSEEGAGNPISDKQNPKINNSEEEDEHIDNSCTETIFKCNQCDLGFKNNKGLKIHVGKAHKVILQQILERNKTIPF
jgi:uncharacterized C2H2 Zn-finger protein